MPQLRLQRRLGRRPSRRARLCGGHLIPLGGRRHRRQFAVEQPLVARDQRFGMVAVAEHLGGRHASGVAQDALIALKAAAEAARAAQPVASGLAVDQLHFGYAITGDKPAWRPLRAFDDGRQTFIEFPASLGEGEAPPLFLVDAKGNAELVNYRVQGRYYVVDRIFDAAELRLGLKHQDVVRISRTGETISRRRPS